MLKGTSASPGIALGKVLVVENRELNIEKKFVQDVQNEEKQLKAALKKSKKELEFIKDKALQELGQDKAEIFETHLLVIEDPELIKQALKKIKDEKVSAAYALKEVRDLYISMFEEMDNEYMKERAPDIKDVSDRVLRNILNVEYIDLAQLEEDVILVAHDLTPSDTAIMKKDKVLGFLTDIGGRTSHTAIMARSLEIPAVVGLKNIKSQVKNGDYVVFNGITGEVIINPDAQTRETYEKSRKAYYQERKELQALIGQETKTLDGREVEVAGNIGTPKDIKGLKNNDAEGVGLYRTEFLYMNRDTLPTEEEQFIAYKKVLEDMDPKPIVIRTLDIGGDKELSYLEMGKELNPFLGYRAIRICLDRPDIFTSQLRALLRASVYGNLRIMFPMISSLEELLAAKAAIEEVKKELTVENISYANDIEVGMMIEVPSAAIISDILAKHVDFFSIGTNDLIQYTCAVDRMNEKIHHLYNQFNPAVLRLIKLVIDNGHQEGKWVGMCGEAAGYRRMIPILLGMGLDEFSMSPISILPARKLINSLKYADMQKLAEHVLTLGTAEDVENYIKEAGF